MGNQHSASHAHLKPKKNVHWKSAGRPAVPGKPDIIPILSDDEPNSITLRWQPSMHDGGAPLQGYQVECNRLGSPEWIRTAPPIVVRPELVLSGLEPPHRYQFRVAAVNVVGRSEYSELSDVLTVSSERGLQEPPLFLLHLEDITVLENDKTEFRVSFSGTPPPTIAWFKDDYEIFSSRRTAITTNESSSILVFHQTLSSDEGEIKCTATNRAGHAVTKARLSLEASPKLRYPRQYEDGLLYEINETVFLKTSIVGKPTPTIEWRHDGQPIVTNERVEITNTPKFSMLKIHSARRSDRGEYQIHASNIIGEDTAAFLVTITAPPDPPRNVSVTRQVDKSVTLDWDPPEDDGGCRIGNYVVEYYRSGWNVWLKATTSRKTNVTLFDLIEGSEYMFRVKAESPYGMSAPSYESAPVRIPGRPVDMEFLAVESKIINEMLTREDGEDEHVSPAPRRKRNQPASPKSTALETPPRRPRLSPSRDHAGSNEFMLVLYPNKQKDVEKEDKRKSFQLDLEDAISPPPISLSAPELSSRCVMPFKSLRNAVSSTELLHEWAMARFYKAVAMKEEHDKQKENKTNKLEHNIDIPYSSTYKHSINDRNTVSPNEPVLTNTKKPEIFIKTDSVDNKVFRYDSELSSSLDSETPLYNLKRTLDSPSAKRSESRQTSHDAMILKPKLRQTSTESEAVKQNSKQISVDSETPKYSSRQTSLDSETSKSNSRQISIDSEISDNRWQTMSFDEDYTASTVSTDGEYSDDGSLNGDMDRRNQYSNDEDTYNPRDKQTRSSPLKEDLEEEDNSEREILKPLPLPDPNFIPKPILKRREPDIVETKPNSDNKFKYEEISKSEENSKFEDKPKKEEKLTIFQKITTKMPAQKSFPFPKLLQKKEPEKPKKIIEHNEIPTKTTEIGNIENKITDEGQTVIDYYGNIVKEFGSQKKPHTTLYLKTEELKIAAEKQQKEKNVAVAKKVSRTKKSEENKTGNIKKVPDRKKELNTTAKQTKQKKPQNKTEKTKINKKETPSTTKQQEKTNKSQDKCIQQVVLKTAERATIVIPIDYKKLEETAKVNVRSAIDYMVDMCLLMLAFWVYFFKDERLAIPFLILIIYRQLQETLTINIPEWKQRYTPRWLKRKAS